MLNIAVFGATVSYVLMMLSHIVLRRREPELERPYRTPGGVATSGVALVLAALAVVATFLVDEKAALDHARRLRGRRRLLLPLLPPPPRRLRSRGGVRGDAGGRDRSSHDHRRAPRRRRRRHHRHRDPRLLRHAGPPAGQAAGRPTTSSTTCVAHDAEACNYLLAVDVDMNTVDGYAMSSWETRLRRLRACSPTSPRCGPVPWHPAHGDVHGRPRLARRRAPWSPRRARSCAASSTGSPSAAGSRSPPPSWSSSSSATPTRRPGARPTATSSRPTTTTSTTRILGTSRVEPLLGRIRREMAAAGLAVENSKGECNFGQHEINFRYEDALPPPTRTRSTRTAPRRSPPRRARRSPSWPSTTSARATRATSTCPCGAEDGTPLFAEQPERVRRASWPASSPACAS